MRENEHTVGRVGDKIKRAKWNQQYTSHGGEHPAKWNQQYTPHGSEHPARRMTPVTVEEAGVSVTIVQI